jgi:hypothetical protein
MTSKRWCDKCKIEIPPWEPATHHRWSEYYDTWEHADCVASLKTYLQDAQNAKTDADARNARLVQQVEALTDDLADARAILDLAEKAAAVWEPVAEIMTEYHKAAAVYERAAKIVEACRPFAGAEAEKGWVTTSTADGG